MRSSCILPSSTPCVVPQCRHGHLDGVRIRRVGLAQADLPLKPRIEFGGSIVIDRRSLGGADLKVLGRRDIIAQMVLMFAAARTIAIGQFGKCYFAGPALRAVYRIRTYEFDDRRRPGASRPAKSMVPPRAPVASGGIPARRRPLAPQDWSTRARTRRPIEPHAAPPSTGQPVPSQHWWPQFRPAIRQTSPAHHRRERGEQCSLNCACESSPAGRIKGNEAGGCG